MLETFIKLIHIISGMVYFGLPFTFGRWYSTATSSGRLETINLVVARMMTFLRVHLTISALVVMGTGIYLAVVRGWWQGAAWPHLAILLMALSLGNLWLNLRPALARLKGMEDPNHPFFAAARVRIAIFSATHHTLVTLITALMVFRNYL